MTRRFGDQRDWFFEKRFGLFIHWGLYAIPAWHEQVQWRKGISRASYVKLIDRFNPTAYDPDVWLDLAVEAGMEYVCFTTKHHDGFCMWDTDETSFNVMNSPYGKDILRALSEACHRREMPLCLYYSVVDWHHPNYPTQGKSHELPAPEPSDTPDAAKYLAYLKAQVRELCTRYGEIHGFWWDMNRLDHGDKSLNDMIRSLQPKAVINNRGFDEGDFGTPERDFKPSLEDVQSFNRPTEACQSVGAESWGYRAEEDYFSDRFLIESIDKTLAKRGNYLLNVGPDARGGIPPQATRMLRNVGAWYGKVRDAFDQAEPASHLIENRDVLLTRKGKSLYVHLFRYPSSEAVALAPIKTMPRRAVLLNTGAPVRACVDLLPSRFRDGKECLRLRGLPVNDLTDTVMVVRLDFEEFAVDIRKQVLDSPTPS